MSEKLSNLDAYESCDGKLEVLQITENELAEVAEFEKQHFDIGKPYSKEDYEKIFSIGHIYALRSEVLGLVGVAAQTYGPSSHQNLKIQENEAYLAGIVIHTKTRAKGFAKLLLDACEKIAKNNNIARILTCIRPSNIGSLKAFTKAGYHIIGAAQGIMPYDRTTQDNGDRCILAKDLQLPNISLNESEKEICAFIDKYKGRIQEHCIGADGHLFLRVLPKEE